MTGFEFKLGQHFIKNFPGNPELCKCIYQHLPDIQRRSNQYRVGIRLCPPQVIDDG